jgi:hypothetical protein
MQVAKNIDRAARDPTIQVRGSTDGDGVEHAGSKRGAPRANTCVSLPRCGPPEECQTGTRYGTLSLGARNR